MNLEKLRCHYCNKRVVRRVKTIHENVCQPVRLRVFCSDKCKESWQFDIQHDRKRSILTWSIGEYYGKYFFVQKIVEVKAKKFRVSMFSMDLNIIEKLELGSSSKILRVVRGKT